MKKLLMLSMLVALLVTGSAEAKSRNPLPWQNLKDAAFVFAFAPYADQTTEFNEYTSVNVTGPFRCKARSSRSWGCYLRLDFRAADDQDYRTPPAPIESCFARVWLWADGYMFPATGWGCNPNWRL